MLFRPLPYVLYLYISTSRSICAVPNMAVVCSPLISPFPGTLLRYCLSDFEMVPVAHIITGITFCFHITHALNFYCEVFKFIILSDSFLITILSPGIGTSISMHIPFFMITYYGVLFLLILVHAYMSIYCISYTN